MVTLPSLVPAPAVLPRRRRLFRTSPEAAALGPLCLGSC